MTAGAGMLSCMIGVRSDLRYDNRCDAALGTIREACEHFKCVCVASSKILKIETLMHLQLVIPLSTHLPEASTKNNNFRENKF